MDNPELHVRVDTGHVMTKGHYHSVMMLIKVLFRLQIIDEEQALKIATKFHILSV